MNIAPTLWESRSLTYRRDWRLLQLFCLWVWQTAAQLALHLVDLKQLCLPAIANHTTSNCSLLEGKKTGWKKSNQKPSTCPHPSMSPLMRTRKLLAFMKYLPQFSKTSGLSAQNKQKLISTRWTFHLLLLLHSRKRFSLCLEQGKKQYPLCLYSFHHDDLVPFVHINENWRWYQQPSSRWCSHLVGVWLQSNSKHWR